MNENKAFRIYNIQNARKAIWEKVPEEIHRIKKRKGLMQPAGSIVYAESETRKLQEILWVFKNLLKEKQITIDNLKNSLRALLEHFSIRIGGWCGLTDTSTLLKNASELISRLDTSEELNNILDELMLYSGRVNMWIDLLIPWNDLNEQMKENFQKFFID
jgi:hypothetical protein